LTPDETYASKKEPMRLTALHEIIIHLKKVGNRLKNINTSHMDGIKKHALWSIQP
jgi:hypothetical protein